MRIILHNLIQRNKKNEEEIRKATRSDIVEYTNIETRIYTQDSILMENLSENLREIGVDVRISGRKSVSIDGVQGNKQGKSTKSHALEIMNNCKTEI